MQSWEGTEELLAKLGERLSCSLEDASDSSQASRLRKSQVCDRVLRICVEQMAKPGGCPAQVTSLVAVAETACQGYLSAVPQPAPLYLEKILYHLLRNTAGQGSGDACWRVADLLRARLLAHRPGQVPCKDFTAIAYSSFSVLWRAADALAQPEQPQEEEGRAALSVRLRALRFLLLLEEDGAALLPLQPPFFTSQTAQQAAAAAVLYEAQRAPSSAFLGRQLGDCLLAALRNEATQPPALQQRFCFFELTLEQCRHFCKGGQYSEAKEAVKGAEGFLGATGSSAKSFGDALSLLEAGVELSQALAESTCPAGPPFSQAAAALGAVAEVSERFLRVLAESCQFLVCSLGEYVKRSRQQPFGQEDVLGLCAFTEGHCRVLRRLLQRVPSDGIKQKLAVKQLLYRSLQLFASAAYDAFQCSQLAAGWPGLERLTRSCRRSVGWMLQALEGLPEGERAKYLDITASCTFKLAYIFYNQNLHQEASSVCELFCQSLQAANAYACPEILPERLHKCFRLQVESSRKLGRLERALAWVVRWLVALRGRVGELLAEPVSLWVRVKMDAAKQGAEELRLRTLKEGLEGHSLDTETLVTVLFAELKAYKTLRADTGQERYNVLCDLLAICSEESGRLHERAVGLTELAQVLCYHSYAQQTDCSSLDSVREALRLLELVPSSAQNHDRLLDDRAQALLWLYICTLESKLEESIEREQRVKAQGLKNLEDFEPNDLNYEGRQLEDGFLYSGISFNLATERALCQSLDDAFALWKQLLMPPGVPAVRSPEQTVTSLHLLATLYKLMAKPLQALESYLLARALCGALGDSLGTASALCQVTKLLFQLECPSYAQLFLEETESCLQKGDSGDDSYLLLQQTCLLLRSQLCCVNHGIEEGLTLLLEVLQNPALQKITKVWYLLRAHVLWLVAVYLSLPPSRLLPELREQIFVQGWKSPKTALVESQKLFRSIILLLMGSDVLGCQTAASNSQFVDYGDNLLLKWQVLADLLACSQHLVALLSRLEVVCKAKAFCLEAVKLATKLQAPRWCTSFLVLKAQLELQQSELELSHFNLQQALFLLESDTEFKTSKKQKSQTKILPRKCKLESRKPQDPISEPPGEEESFLKGPALEFVATVSGLEKKDALTASPELKPQRKKRLAFLTHPAACTCCLCSDLALSALCLRWLLSCAQAELAAGNAAEGLGLIRAVLPRRAAVASRFAAELRDKLWGGSLGRELPTLGLLDDLVATGYAMLAIQSLASPRPAEELQEEVETGLTFLASCSPHLPSLEVSRASLLLSKAMATICHLASKRSDSVDGVFADFQTCQLPTAEPKQAAAPRTVQIKRAEPRKSKPKPAPAPAAPKPRAKKNRRVKPRAGPNTDDVFALGDSDSEVPPIIIRPVTVPCTPHQKVCPPAKTRAAPSARTPFTIFSDCSPPASKSQLLRAPRALGKVKSRLRVTFSDDSDVEDPKAGLTPAAIREKSCLRKTPLPKSREARASSGGCSDQSSSPPPWRGRGGPRRAKAAEEKRERVTRRNPAKRAEEERELLRAIEEEEKVEEELEMSFEVLRASEEEEGAPGRSRLPRCRQEGADGQREVWQHEMAAEDVLGARWLGSGDPLCLGGTLSSALPAADDVSSLDTVLELLKDAFSCISHCPPGALYSQLCRLLALAMGNQDPLSTAYLLSESVSVTTRHQLLGVIHRKIHKEKKAAGDVAERLGGLSIGEDVATPRSPRLAQLEGLFLFGSAGLGAGERERFWAQLQQIPSGVTVCLLTLASPQPGSGGDTLLLARLEPGTAPVNLRIPTALTKAPLRSVLRDFDAIQREQKETNNCTDKQDWWLRRSELDRRMKSLIESLETQVLGCWRGVLLPSAPEPALAEDAARLHPELRRCGLRDPDPALLKAVLNAAPLLTPRDVQALAFGLCPAQPRQAQLLLQEALERRRNCTKGSGGSLVLVLDKHLQKLPWESMPCLQAVPVTRLPSLRFLLSYTLAQQQPAGSVLSRGVNPSSTFYVLNPHSNLLGTEERFRGWFESEPGWRGVTGAVPSTKQMQAALLEHDLYIYAGHGAGARLLDGQTIARMDCRAVALLFGCSSAALAVRGSLEGSGIVLKYIMAGCPLVLGNLWDVTDRDIDRYAQALLQGWLRGGSGAPLLSYVAQARQAPKLKYLIGAAPVAYGLPVCLQ